MPSGSAARVPHCPGDSCAELTLGNGCTCSPAQQLKRTLSTSALAACGLLQPPVHLPACLPPLAVHDQDAGQQLCKGHHLEQRRDPRRLPGGRLRCGLPPALAHSTHGSFRQPPPSPPTQTVTHTATLAVFLAAEFKCNRCQDTHSLTGGVCRPRDTTGSKCAPNLRYGQYCARVGAAPSGQSDSMQAAGRGAAAAAGSGLACVTAVWRGAASGAQHGLLEIAPVPASTLQCVANNRNRCAACNGARGLINGQCAVPCRLL